jgi:hypothetical protein
MIEENQYRGVVHKALKDQPISNFMLSNCKVPFNNGLFRFTVKTSNQALITPLCNTFYLEKEKIFAEFAPEIDRTQFIIF